MEQWQVIAGVVATANAVAFVQVWIDKRRAEAGRYRLSERRLIAPVLLGGLPGLLLGMRRFRHKTRKRSFQLKLAAATVGFVGAVVLAGRFWFGGGGG